MKIVAIGPLWRGSNAGGLFRALSREGCLLDVVDEYYYLSFHSCYLPLKIVQKLIRSWQVKEFNAAIRRSLDVFTPDVLLVYKGAFVLPGTLKYAESKGIKLALFYPDVSMATHGKYLQATIPLYHIVFTTKTFGIKDFENAFGIKNSHFIPHGFDPEVHRKLEGNENDMLTFGCDVSFIGTYSPKKAKWLSVLKEKCPDINLKIWGDQWNKATNPVINSSIQGRAVLGDLYALAIQYSKINLGILSEQVTGASSGDLITSRTFHIPGSSGFMLHERNEESVLYYEDNKETVFFNGVDDMVGKVKYYLAHPDARENIRLAGYKRALRDHSLDQRAKKIIQLLVN
jgi:spore maturation protein CgeB